MAECTRPSTRLDARSVSPTAGQFTSRRSIIDLRWWRGVVVSGVRRMNDVNARRARLVPGWVTVFGRVCHLGM